MMKTTVKSVIFILYSLLAVLTSPPRVAALTQILPEASVEADQQSIAELIGTFDRAEEAIRDATSIQ